ncbi:hypothetical protein [Acidithrix sp. C25]|uniref:hypothetical protein n=1 Tax=Acidithrix sp. C25 TaxID=1671482 RepID=UPI00191BBCCF|nr:hypothetical protein [Acidithrix sp. C25]
MFIRETPTINKKTGISYSKYQLVESYRCEKVLLAIENCKLVDTKNAYKWPSLLHILPQLAFT